MAQYNFWAILTALTGGGAQSLDGVAYADIGSDAFAVVTVGGKAYLFRWDASATDAENTSTHPFVVAPDDVGSNPGRWKEQRAVDFANDTLLDEVPASSDLLPVYDASAGTYKRVAFHDVRDAEFASRTINFDNSMTAAQIQAEIDAVGRYIAPGVTITFQFADGTYTLTGSLSFEGFYGGGNIVVQGNTSETDATTLHTSQQVFLDFSSGTCNGLEFSLCYAKVKVRNLKIKVADSSYYRALFFDSCYWFDAWYNYLLSTGTTNAQLLIATGNSTGYAKYNYFEQGRIAIYSNGSSHLMSAFNDDTGTMPAYGLWADTNGVIGKNSTQPAGSTANENTGTGGVIR